MKYLCWILIFGSIILCVSSTVLLAQQKIKGKVVDESALPIKNAQVSINGSNPVSTGENGEFDIPLFASASNPPKVVKATKNGLIIKDWQYKNGEVQVVMSEPIVVKGRVLSFKSVPISNINVSFINVRGLKPVQTDEKGNFSFSVPKGTDIEDASRYIVFDPDRLKGTADFDFRKSNDGLIYLIVNVPPRQVRKVKILLDENTPVANCVVLIDEKKYTTDQEGEIKPEAQANDLSSFKVENYFIKSLKYEEVGNLMEVLVNPPDKDNATPQKAVTLIDEQIDKEAKSIIITKTFLEGRVTQTETEIEKIQKTLESKENISPEERAKLLERLKILQDNLAKDTRALSIAQEKAQDAYLELQKAFSIQKEESDKFKAEKEKAVLKNQLSQERAKRNTSIFLIIASALMLILGIIFFNYRKINKQRNELAEKIAEINLKNEMLEESARIMDLKNKQINDKNERLLEQTEELEFKNAKITDSIRYARTIQQSILPSQDEIGNFLQDFFIFYEPKDIVSGDFYWFSRSGNEAVIAVADCTGHGVPGAFMTMMGNTLLNEIVHSKQITQPALILENLNEKVQNTFKQHKYHELKDGDGMDIVVLHINLDTRLLTFSGAKNSLYFVQDNELIYFKGSNVTIGSSLLKKEKIFDSRTIWLKGNETFYLTTDGFQDQLGGTNIPTKRKKFLKTRFMDLIQEIMVLPLNEQAKILQDTFHNWKGENEQTDDVLIMVFKVPEKVN